MAPVGHIGTRRMLAGSVLLAALFVALMAGTAYAAPVVTNAKFSNPVAYELKSLLTTRFTCDVDTAGTWGRLDILGASGIVKTIYNGPLVQGTNWFPLWNGLDASGKRLPSASYDWRLTVSKGGESTVVTGKITVSKIHFFIKGRLQDLAAADELRYMIPGNANIYYDMVTADILDVFSLELYDPVGGEVGFALWTFDFAGDRKRGTLYLRNNPGNDTSIHIRGMHNFHLEAANDVTYYFTVIQ